MSKTRKFYLWQPFPEIEADFIRQEVGGQGDIICSGYKEADIIFASVANGTATIYDIRKRKAGAVIVALIKQGGNQPLRKRCINDGANMAFCMPAKEQGFKAMLTRIYARL